MLAWEVEEDGWGIGWSCRSVQTKINNDLIPEILSGSKINRLITVGKLYVNVSGFVFSLTLKDTFNQSRWMSHPVLN